MMQTPAITRTLTLAELLAQQGEALKLRLVAGEGGVNRPIDHPRLHKPSLAFAGYIHEVLPRRLHVIGKTETGYLATLPAQRQRQVINDLFDLQLAGVIISRKQKPSELLLDAAKRTNTPLIVCELQTSLLMTQLTLYLTKKLAPTYYHHGVYMDIYGLGVLLIGESGMGKSEVALELISRGHRLIADDVVELVHEGTAIMVGKSPEALRHHLEVRGLGILNVLDLFGAASFTESKKIGLVLELIPWEALVGEDRLPLEELQHDLYGVLLPFARIPVRPGRSLAVLIEVATRNQLLKLRGVHTSQEFIERVQQRINDQLPDRLPEC